MYLSASCRGGVKLVEHKGEIRCLNLRIMMSYR